MYIEYRSSRALSFIFFPSSFLSLFLLLTANSFFPPLYPPLYFDFPINRIDCFISLLISQLLSSYYLLLSIVLEYIFCEPWNMSREACTELHFGVFDRRPKWLFLSQLSSPRASNRQRRLLTNLQLKILHRLLFRNYLHCSQVSLRSTAGSNQIESIYSEDFRFTHLRSLALQPQWNIGRHIYTGSGVSPSTLRLHTSPGTRKDSWARRSAGFAQPVPSSRSTFFSTLILT